MALGASTIHAGRASTYADRRRAAAERLSLAADLSVRLDPVDAAAPATAAIDPDGVLRAAIRALLPLAQRTEGVDLAVSLGPDHRWAARLTAGENGVQVDLVSCSDLGPAPTLTRGTMSTPAADVPSEAELAHDLADLVWAGEVGAR